MGNRQHHPVSVVLMIIGVAVAGGIALAAAFWMIGAVFHLLGALARLALIVGVAAVVWQFVARRMPHDRV